MCGYFDIFWQPMLAFLLVFSLLTVWLRVKTSNRYASGKNQPPRWMMHLLCWGQGFVAITMLLLMVLGFVCAGSPGDMSGIVPN